MATAMIYDTLKLAEQLEHEAGFETARAKAIARILAENSAGNLATREDILLSKAELRAEIQDVRDEVRGVRDELRGHIRVLYWMTGTSITGVAAILGIAITIALHVMRLE